MNQLDFKPKVERAQSIRIRPPQVYSDVNGSIGGEKGGAERKEETAEELESERLDNNRQKRGKWLEGLQLGHMHLA